jgi:hypothetical protein
MALIDPGLLYGAANLQQMEYANPTIGSIIAAHLNTENSIGLVLNSVSEHWEPLRSFFYGPIDPRLKEVEFNINSLEGTHYEPYKKDFLNVSTEAQALAKKQRIDRELEQHDIIARGGITKNLVASLVSGLVDPTSWVTMGAASLPGIAARYGTKLALSASKQAAITVAAASAQSAIMSEAIAQGLSYERTAGESIMNITSSALLGGLFAGGATKATQTARSFWRDKVSEKFEKDIVDIARGNVQQSPLIKTKGVGRKIGEEASAIYQEKTGLEVPEEAITEQKPLVIPIQQSTAKLPSSITAQFKMTGTYPGWNTRAASTALEYFGRMTPGNRLAFSPSMEAQSAAQKLVTYGFSLDSNLNLSATGPTVHSMSNHFKMVQKDQFSSILLDTYSNVRKAGYKISKNQLSEEMYICYTNNQEHAISIVNDGLRKVDAINEQIKQEGISSGVFTKNVRTKFAGRYLPRIWNRAAIKTDRAKFERLAYQGFVNERERILERHHSKFSHLETEYKALQRDIEDLTVKAPEEAQHIELTKQARRAEKKARKNIEQKLTEREKLNQKIRDLENKIPEDEVVEDILQKAKKEEEGIKNKSKIIEYQLSETRKEITKIEQALHNKPNDKLSKNALKKAQEDEKHFIQKLDELGTEIGAIREKASDTTAKEGGDKNKDLLQKTKEEYEKIREEINALETEYRTRTEEIKKLELKEPSGQAGQDLRSARSRQRKVRKEIEKVQRALTRNKIKYSLTDKEILQNVRQYIDQTLFGIDGNISHPVSKRDFSRLIPIENQDALPYIVKDFEMANHLYIEKMGTDIALRKHFNAHENFTETKAYNDMVAEYDMLRKANPEDDVKLAHQLLKDTRDLNAIWDMMRGKFGRTTNNTPDEWVKTAAMRLRAYGVITKLGGMAFSSIADIALGIHHVGIKRFMGTALNGLMRTEGWNLAREEAKTLGFIFDTQLRNTLPRDLVSLTEQVDMHSLPDRMLRRGQNFVSKWSGSEYLEAIKSRLNTMLVQQEIFRFGEAMAKGQATHNQKVLMASIGIDAEKAAMFHVEQKKHGRIKDGFYLGGLDKWSPELQQEFAQRLQMGFDKLSLNPQAWEKPLFFSSTSGKLIGQWMTWAFTSYDKIIVAGLQRSDANTLMGILTQVGLAAMSEQLRAIWMQTREEQRPQDIDAVLSNAIIRSGIMGHAGMMLERVSAIAGGLPAYYLAGRSVDSTRIAAPERVAIQLMGPTAGTLVDVLGASYLAFEEGRNYRNVRSLTKLFPFRNTQPFKFLYDQAEEGLMLGMNIQVK